MGKIVFGSSADIAGLLKLIYASDRGAFTFDV